ncbi:hypothetical protein [Bartonella raoultii]
MCELCGIGVRLGGIGAFSRYFLICDPTSQKSTYPFCSTRCRAIDLNR